MRFSIPCREYHRTSFILQKTTEFNSLQQDLMIFYNTLTLQNTYNSSEGQTIFTKEGFLRKIFVNDLVVIFWTNNFYEKTILTISFNFRAYWTGNPRMQRTSIKILRLSEIRWPDSCELQIQNNEIYYSGNNDPNVRNGITIVVNKTLFESVNSFISISDWVVMIIVSMTKKSWIQSKYTH